MGSLDSPIEYNCTGASCSFDHGTPKTYCLGHEWFDGGKAPYKVFRVSDNTEVLPEAQPETYTCPNCKEQVGGPANCFGMLKCVSCHTAFEAN